MSNCHNWEHIRNKDTRDQGERLEGGKEKEDRLKKGSPLDKPAKGCGGRRITVLCMLIFADMSRDVGPV